MSQYEPEERKQQVQAALLKFGGFTAAIVLFIVVVTVVAVKALDLGSGDDTVGGPEPVQPLTSLPSSALPSPKDTSTPEESETPESPTTSAVPGDDDLSLSASPVIVGAMERINLTGRWPGKDNQSLLIQRFEDGAWVDFGVQVQVKVGTFSTYVLTGREGENKFRAYDPESGSASNEVAVTVE